MATFLEVEDLTVFEPSINLDKAEAMIDDATALALVVAPCIGTETFAQSDAVRAILRGAVLRWNEVGSGALSGQTAGPFSQTIDTRQVRKAMFWPSEITQLQGLCNLSAGVYSVTMAGPDPDPVTDPVWI